MTRIGVQAMMLKGAVQELGLFETLRKVAEIGFGVLEVSQIAMTESNVRELTRARNELGFDICAVSAALDKSGTSGDALTTDFDKVVSDAHVLGATMVRIGMLPLASIRSIESLHAFADAAESMARRLEERQLRLHYHNHHIEFTKFDGRYALDVIAERSPSVGLELDVHWLQRGGVDPRQTIERFAGRVSMIHLKDFRVRVLSEEAEEHLAAGEFAEFTHRFNDVVEFAEVGEGNLDWAGIIPASIEAGARYLVVEQDELYGRDVFDCLQTSRDNLVARGFGDLF